MRLNNTSHTRCSLLIIIMGVRWLVNAGLLVLPIGTTIGVLMGIDASRQSSGQDPIFDGGSGSGAPIGGGGNSGSGGGVGNPHDDKITDKMYCQKQVGIAPPSKGTQYICKQTLLNTTGCGQESETTTHLRLSIPRVFFTSSCRIPY